MKEGAKLRRGESDPRRNPVFLSLDVWNSERPGSENTYFRGAICSDGINAFISTVVLAEFDFHGTTAATVNVVIGIIVTMLAAIELWFMYHNPPRLSANH